MDENISADDNSNPSSRIPITSKHPKTAKPPYYHRDTKTYQEEVGRFGHRRIIRPTAWLTRWVDQHNGLVTAVATAFIAYLTFSLARDSARQAETANNTLSIVSGQLDEMKKTFAVDRAYVWGSDFLGYKGAKPVPGIAAYFSFHNYGKTPANAQDAPVAECVYGARPPNITQDFEIPGFTDKNGNIPTGMIINVDQGIGPFDAKLDASNEQIIAAQSGRGNIYCVSKLRYLDVRDASHETRVCFKYNFTFKAFVFCEEANANYHN